MIVKSAAISHALLHDYHSVCVSFIHSAVDLGVYATLGIGQAVLVLLGSFSMALGAILAARTLHDGMLTSILRSPMSFFDTTPLGRILNRFSKVHEQA